MTTRSLRHALAGFSVVTKAVVPAAVLTLIGLSGGTTSAAVHARPLTRPMTQAASSTSPVRVASFNISSLTLDNPNGVLRPWKERRGAVIAEILQEHVDVIGIQEAAPGRSWPDRVVDGPNQYLDLLNGLNKAGGHYALVTAAGFNCLKPDTAYHCHPYDRDASGGERILYNTDTLQLLGRNSMAYAERTARNSHPFLAWGRFQVRSNGHQFRFFTTHLDPRDRAVRTAQWEQMINEINAVSSDGLPLVSVGDFNTQKFDPLAKQMFPAMEQSGYGEVLNEQYDVNPNSHIRAASRTNAWISSVNHTSRDVRTFSYDDAQYKTGNSIDHIFATNRLRVEQYKVVLNYDSQLQVQGVLPSDHNMIAATIAM